MQGVLLMSHRSELFQPGAFISSPHIVVLVPEEYSLGKACAGGLVKTLYPHFELLVDSWYIRNLWKTKID
jgi:hypothetical protein